LVQTFQIGKNITNEPKQNQTVINHTNGHKIFQMVMKYTNIYHSKPPPQFPQIWDFWFENKPSGNPGKETGGNHPMLLLTTNCFRDNTVAAPEQGCQIFL
jgi:hypothetical protein